MRRSWGRASLLLSALLVCMGVAPPEGRGQATAGVLDRIVGLEFVDVSLEEALNQIRRNTGIGLVYSPDLLPANHRVACPCTERTVGEALELILRDTGLTFTATQTQVRIVPRERPRVRATLGAVGGVVTERTTGEPVPNALVGLSDGRGTLTNDNGRFILLNVPPGSYELEISGLGWEPSRIAGILVEGGVTAAVDVQMVRRVIPLSALVVSPGTFGILDEAGALTLETLSREQIETIPQLGEDVFRALRRLPGVASSDVSTRLSLRGSLDRDVLMLLDGMELYEPYHLKDFEGVLGIVDINAVGSIDLHTGGFPVDYGNRMAGVFDMETRPPPAEGNRTTLGLSFTNATAMSQGTFSDGKGEWLLSARRGYLDIILAMVDADEGFSPRYYDFLGKVQYQLGSRHLVSAHLLQAGDNLFVEMEEIQDSRDEGDLTTSWGNTYVWGTWKAFFSPRVRARTMVSAGRVSRSRVGGVLNVGRVEGPELADVFDEASFSFAGVKQDWTVDFTDRLAARAGASVKRLQGDYDYLHWTRTLEAAPNGDLVGVYDTTQVRIDPDGTEFGSFLALRFKPLSWATGEVGLRYDRHTQTGDSDLSPRLHAVVELGENTTLRAGWGLYHQSQGMNEMEASDGEMEFAPSERATQIAAGLEHDFGGEMKARVEVYHREVDRPRRQYLNLWREMLPFPELDGDRRRIQPTEARAVGLELLAQKSGPRWDWSASYTLSSSEDRIAGDWVPRMMDQRHALSFTAAYRPNSRWSLSAAWQYRSGWPFTPQVIEYDTLSVFQEEGYQWPLRWRQEFGELNSVRLPAYHRLDLRVTRQFALRRSTIEVYADLFNAYDNENLRAFDYSVRDIGGRAKFVRDPGDMMMPIVPSLGFRWVF